MSNAVFTSSLADIYRECMYGVNDAVYCAGVVEAVVHASSTMIYTTTPEGRTKPRFHVMRPSSDYVVNIFVDKNKESVIIMLRGRGHSIDLLYKREGDRFVLKKAVISSIETIALMNGPLNLSKSKDHEVW
jgi:hypothetical protein